MDMTNDLSNRARRGAAAMCRTTKRTIETNLPTWIQSLNYLQQIEADQHCHQQMTHVYIYNANAVGRKQCRAYMLTWLPHQRLDKIFHRPRRWTHQCCGRWHGYIRVSLVVIQSAVRQMENNICVNNDKMVSHSLPDTPFSLISPLALSNHLILGLPLFRISIVILPTQCSSLLTMPVPVPHPILDFHCDFSHFRFLDPVSFIRYPVDLCNFLYPSWRSFSVTQHYTDSLQVLLTVLHAEGTSASSSLSSSNVGPRWLFECVHSLYCLFL